MRCGLCATPIFLFFNLLLAEIMPAASSKPVSLVKRDRLRRVDRVNSKQPDGDIFQKGHALDDLNQVATQTVRLHFLSNRQLCNFYRRKVTNLALKWQSQLELLRRAQGQAIGRQTKECCRIGVGPGKGYNSLGQAVN
ncbi:Uncharacterised protein [Burkholderia pseudomallei]|nr:hypothetical protein X894_1737 [Burkholderia pseudomallei MSHR4462]CAJ2736453.1 Uncharacterised protein [Burkholderia pseudomallei]CAJ4323196.1 Uncharacterised protein [Burkholderia pseudomallei]